MTTPEQSVDSVDEAKEAIGAEPKPPEPVTPAAPVSATKDEDVEDATSAIALPPGAERNIRRGQEGHKQLPPQIYHIECASEVHIERGEGSRFKPVGRPAAGVAVLRLDIFDQEIQENGEHRHHCTVGVRIPTNIEHGENGDVIVPKRNERGDMMVFFGSNHEQQQFQNGHNRLMERLLATCRAADMAAAEQEGKTLGKEEVGKTEQFQLNLFKSAEVSGYDASRAYVRQEVYGPIKADVLRFCRFYDAWIDGEIRKLELPSSNDEPES
jgi:hypothetical protein